MWRHDLLFYFFRKVVLDTKLLQLADELLADVAKGVYECTRYAVAVEE